MRFLLLLLFLLLSACGKSPQAGEGNMDDVGAKVKSIFACNTQVYLPALGDQLPINYYIETYENGEVVVGCSVTNQDYQKNLDCGADQPFYSYSFQTQTSPSDPTLVTITNTVSPTLLSCKTVVY